MSRFKPFAGFQKEFEIKIGPAIAAWNREEFAVEIREEVERILDFSFDPKETTRTDDGGYYFWYTDDRFEATLIVDDPDNEFPFDRIPVDLDVRSNLDEVPDWELVESLYDRLDALGKYYLLAMSHNSALIASNYDVGDKW
ncbi:hypothetical protein [Streptomyces jumonjinensis]|uniref:Uncharacterized protein n=1 Tax=Streptomyces jumonjinensis TaxID=1945 RepID=A0A646KLN5_STRJU|nr:hypothetical protein [Streptomyces jumonjinensis]MQT02861.1 hypothetical protein [Streptomyces jumonjinensis]